MLQYALFVCLSILADTACAAGDSAATEGVPEPLPARLREAGQQLRRQLPHDLRGMPFETFLLMHQAVPSQLLQQAADLAALMQQYYALPAVAAERQLAVAQAAAGRSCAYLRCANLGGEGGPAAGQGAGSMRCRWARRVEGADAWSREQQAEACCCCCCWWRCGACADLPQTSLEPCAVQRLPRGVVLRHRLLARRLAGGRAPSLVQGAGRCAAGGQAGGGASFAGSGRQRPGSSSG